MITALAQQLRADIPPNLGVTMRPSHFPFQSLIVEWAGAIQSSALVIAGITLVIAAAGWGIGRVGNGQGAMQRISFGVLITCAIVAVFIGAAFAITAWFASVDTGF
jgi:hypothetical protein